MIRGATDEARTNGSKGSEEEGFVIIRKGCCKRTDRMRGPSTFSGGLESKSIIP
jgi:hypothetical protein